MKQRFRAALALCTALVAVSLSPLSATVLGTGPEASLGTWESSNGKIRMDLRSAGNGSFDAVIVWVADDADAAARSRVGKSLASGFTWNPKAGKFEDGAIVFGEGDRGGILSCVLAPQGDDILVLTAKKGFFSRKTEWKRVR